MIEPGQIARLIRLLGGIVPRSMALPGQHMENPTLEDLQDADQLLSSLLANTQDRGPAKPHFLRWYAKELDVRPLGRGTSLYFLGEEDTTWWDLGNLIERAVGASPDGGCTLHNVTVTIEYETTGKENNKKP